MKKIVALLLSVLTLFSLVGCVIARPINRVPTNDEPEEPKETVAEIRTGVELVNYFLDYIREGNARSLSEKDFTLTVELTNEQVSMEVNGERYLATAEPSVLKLTAKGNSYHDQFTSFVTGENVSLEGDNRIVDYFLEYQYNDLYAIGENATFYSLERFKKQFFKEFGTIDRTENGPEYNYYTNLPAEEYDRQFRISKNDHAYRYLINYLFSPLFCGDFNTSDDSNYDYRVIRVLNITENGDLVNVHIECDNEGYALYGEHTVSEADMVIDRSNHSFTVDCRSTYSYEGQLVSDRTYRITLDSDAAPIVFTPPEDIVHEPSVPFR